MGLWWWVLIFVGIGVFALALYAVLGLGLWRKVKVLMADLGRLSATVASAEAAMSASGRPDGSGSLADDSIDDESSAVHRG